MLSPQSWQPTCIGYLRSRTKDFDASFVLIISTKLSKLIGIQSMLALDAVVLTKFVNHTDSLLSRHSMLAGSHNLQGGKNTKRYKYKYEGKYKDAPISHDIP